MDFCTQCNKHLPHDNSLETIKELKERIVQLEKELKNQKDAVRKGAKLYPLIWGDSFNNESLH